MLFLVFALANTVVYAQSKKKQIITLNSRVDSFRLALSSEIKLSNKNRITLNSRVDSLNAVVHSERQDASQSIQELNSTIDGLILTNGDLNSLITQLKNDISSLESYMDSLAKLNLKFKTDLEAMTKRNLELEAKLKIQETNVSKPKKEVVYKSYSPCSFTINLPSNFKMKKPWPSSPDFCDYTVTIVDGFEPIELHSLNKSRFGGGNIKELYVRAVKKSELNITYKIQSNNWFIISGVKRNGDIVYWKRVLGGNFISDLSISYPPNRKSLIEPYIATISNSFKSE
jgi:hypothetical protein